ncbi:OLC1v1004315C1 [Oldenlandia corymbosa var. corymbosa]|uniref:soluble epoxide hydrolase n=1 Tax=Oldenlandia corymbosa var. corymbosa TaxID=529605 RepID=A0AAV1DFF7_OLDCO|nr:OLC1v1004315C1 [Oldenlandia corymbosa var. corymbosa]
MENIRHQTLPVSGINLHVAEIGEGPAVLFLHGFPELWYSWRHQMVYLASKGYRAIAPDLRGYGDSDAPAGASNYTAFHIVGDLVALLDSLGLNKVFLVGHDWGAIIAWYFCLFRPDRIKALVNFSCAFRYFDPKDSAKKPVAEMREMFGDDYYVCRFQAPGEVEEELAGVDVAALMKAFFVSRESGTLCIPKGAFGFMAQAAAQSLPFPDWLTQDDVDYFAAKHSKNGLTGGINFYRAIDLNWELSEAWVESKIQVPVRFVVGDLDLTYHMPGMQDYLHNGGFKKDVPNLEKVVVIEGAAHFINQEKPDVCNTQIHEFISKF